MGRSTSSHSEANACPPRRELRGQGMPVGHGETVSKYVCQLGHAQLLNALCMEQRADPKRIADRSHEDPRLKCTGEIELIVLHRPPLQYAQQNAPSTWRRVGRPGWHVTNACMPHLLAVALAVAVRVHANVTLVSQALYGCFHNALPHGRCVSASII